MKSEAISPMNKRNMELSDKEYTEVAEKLDAEQVILENTDIIDNQYENLLETYNNEAPVILNITNLCVFFN